MSRLLSVMENVIRDSYQPHGVNCGYNGGAGAGAGIPGHFHVHMLPRWNADTNFMTVIGDTRVIPERLEDTEARLSPLIAAALAGTDL
jgi:ATP adenylyltransferase